MTQNQGPSHRPGRMGEVRRRAAGLTALAVLLTASGCGEGTEARPGDATDLPTGTARMVTLMDSMAAHMDPARNRFANDRIVERLRAVPVPEDPRERLTFQAAFGEQLLNAAEFEEAIGLFEGVLDELAGHRADGSDGILPQDFEILVLDHLAAAHLRRGERASCTDGWNARACLFPVPPEGVHEDPTDVRRAAEIYEEILQRDPDRMGPLWLLNVTRMMSGEYPDGVPERWLLPPSAFESEYDIGLFRDVSRPMGLDMVGRVGGGVMDDFEGNGLLDVIASSRGDRDQLRYFRNEGDGTFTDRTEAAGLKGITGGANFVHADFDNSGHLDVLLLRGGWLEDGWPNSLLRNRGDGTFEDVTEAAGLLQPMLPTQTAGFADVDGNGLLDLVIGTESRGAHYHPMQFFRNNGDGTFSDVTAETGVEVGGVIKGLVWGDTNNNGRPDLYVSRHGDTNVLLRNDGPDQDGRWRFTDVTADAGVGEPIHSFPTWFFDYDNDGWLDIFVSGYRTYYGDIAAEYLGRPHESELPRLYRNRGDGTFEDVTAQVGLDRILFAMGANFGDLDGDGWPDMILGTGDALVQALFPNRVMRNDGGSRFQDVTTSGGFGFLHKGHGVAFGDVFGDGNQDIFQTFGGAFEGDLGRSVLLKNPGHGNRWITLALEGVQANRFAVGARIRVTVETEEGPRDIHHLVGSGGSFGSNPLRAEVGLGQATAIREVRIEWPGSGTVQELQGLELDRAYRIREGEAQPEPFDLPRVPIPEEDRP